jgi:serine/threonine-protein kinase
MLLRWLVRAHAAQVFTLLFAVFVWAGLPKLTDAVERSHPPITTTKAGFLGLFERREQRPDPRLATRLHQLHVSTWAVGITTIGLLLLAAVPSNLAANGPAAGGHAPAPSPGPATAARRPPPASDDDTGTIFAPVTEPGLDGQPLANRYRRLEEIGRGGMGVVHRAFDLKLEREVALKSLPFHVGERPEITRRFRQEAQLLARLSHPHVVNVYDLFEADTRLWMALELVRGGTLAQDMARSDGSIPLPRALRFARQVASGLAYAHGRGIVHRDVKPSNVLLTLEPDPIAKLNDFGIAKLLDATAHTQVGTLIGSARYMSPELAAGEPADERADIYALGVTIYELVTGRTPFEGEVRSVLARQISTEPPPLRSLAPSVPERLESLVGQLLAKNPDQRPAGLAPVIAALADLEDELGAA